MRAMVKVDTQKIREGMLQSLQELFTLAKQQAQNRKLDLRQRQKWIRVASYVAQVTNSLTKSFDEAAITKDLEQLEKMVNEAMAKRKDKGTQGEATTAPGS
jgi:ArsR family metal-binding transcriptional regulator